MMRAPTLTKALTAPHSPSRRRWSRGLFCWTAAAALTSSNAFAPYHRHHHCKSSLQTIAGVAPFGLTPRQTPKPRLQTLRLYSSKKDGEGFLEKAAGAVKSILPKRWTQTEDEKRTELSKQRVRDQVSGGMTELLKDAPLPIRMMGKMMAPLMSGMASELAETVGEQQRQMQELLDDAKSYIMRDETATNALGEPIVVQAPFSQSSSTTTINGQTKSQTQASFPIQGSSQSGVATMTATQDGISSLVVQVGGRNIPISLSKRGPPNSGTGAYTQRLGKNRRLDDDIIDVEFVEKK